MNNSKIWLVVNSTMGLPLFLSAVAISSVAVHLAPVHNTDWIEQYHQGDTEAMAAVDTDTDVQEDHRVPGADRAFRRRQKRDRHA